MRMIFFGTRRSAKWLHGTCDRLAERCSETWMRVARRAPMGRWVPMALLALGLSGCLAADIPKHERPLSYGAKLDLERKGMRIDAPIMLRIFKKEGELEVWKRGKSGGYSLFRSYDICKWSGKLGPKLREGDRQAPEGFYHVRPHQMNPQSNYHLSFNLGYPNRYDASWGRTGSHLMVHGGCSSAGCYAMTDDQVEEIYILAREAFDGGQEEIQVQAYPFRMTDENLAEYQDHPWIGFWQQLKAGYDAFETQRRPVNVAICNRSYLFNANFSVSPASLNPTGPCPPLLSPPSFPEAPNMMEANRSGDPSVVPTQASAANTVPVAGANIPANGAIAPGSTRPTTPAALSWTVSPVTTTATTTPIAPGPIAPGRSRSPIAVPRSEPAGEPAGAQGVPIR